ncbi:MAG: hypothetical protein EB072_00885 [Betaproteobacteria bacterium]|nr:hypothetical protein [Betaproteobacteria bacterium]
MSTSTGNLSLIPRYDPATANQVKTSNTNIGSTAEEIQNNFMRMLIAQMQNQNPLNPMDNAQFASQLAQMSQLQGIENMRASIDSFVKQVSDGRLLDQSALVGREVLAAAPVLNWDGSNPANFAVNADAVLSNAVLRIRGSDGKVIDEIALGGVGPELQMLTWDGSDKQGSVVPVGAYQVAVEGLTYDGKSARGNVLSPSTVQSVQRAASGVQVRLTDGRMVDDTQILQIGASRAQVSGP